MKYMLIVILLLVGCGEKIKTVEVEVIKEVDKIIEVENTELNISREYIDRSTYWNIPQYYGENKDIPKYTAVGTYTNKHIPVAFKANGDIYHTFTDNTEDEHFRVYAMKNNEEKVLVHKIENWNDPHTNGIIHVLESGIVHVHIASRGLLHKFQSGKILESQTPYELDFVCIDGCENTNIEAYPQVWETSWGEHVGYTHYIKDTDYHDTINIRSLWYRVGDKRVNIAKGGHYAMSLYEDGYMYVVYNSYEGEHPDYRVNLYALKTNDGINWTTLDNAAVTLPLEPFDTIAQVYDTEGYGYLKDLKVDDKGLNILFTDSDGKDPTQGKRFTKEWTKDGVRVIAETNHNYNGAAYIGDNIIHAQDGQFGRAGGDLVLYKDYKEVDRDSSDSCTYVRKVVNSDNEAVVSCVNYHLTGTGTHHILTVD